MNTPVPHPIYYFTPLHLHSKAVKVTYTTKYLGVSVSEKGRLKSYIGPKLLTARQSFFNKLQRLWSHNDIETKEAAGLLTLTVHIWCVPFGAPKRFPRARLGVRMAGRWAQGWTRWWVDKQILIENNTKQKKQNNMLKP